MTHVAVIGAYGSAGVAVAEQLMTEDIELTLIDDGVPGGGLCILRGCMPSKEVLSAGAHRFQARHDHRLVGTPPTVDLEAVVETKNEHVSDFAAHRRAAVHEMAEAEHVEFIHDSARFIDEHTLLVGDREIRADYIVIATGSEVKIPELPGMSEVDPVTSAEVLDATYFPDSGIVMGFGFVGLELAPYLVEAGGMELTVIEHDEHPIDEAEPPFGEAILDIYREEFDITILTETTEERVTSTNTGVRLHTDRDDEYETIDADALYTFTGRDPNLAGLDLEKTRITPRADWVTDTMQTLDDPRVFVVGDANGQEPILHVAKEQGIHAARNILAHRNGDAVTPYENTHHHVIFSGLGIYPFARIGHTEPTARTAGHEVVTATRYARDDGVFRTKDVPRGLAKFVVDASDGTVLGYQGLHYHADTMAKTMQIIVENSMDVHDLPDRAYHPTLPEILDGLFRETKAKLS